MMAVHHTAGSSNSRRDSRRGTGNRSCIGCGERVEPERRHELIRLVVVDGQAMVDLAARAPGRGAWIHPLLRCLARAERGLSKAARTRVAVDVAALSRNIELAANERVRVLLGVGRRSGKAVAGTTQVEDAWRAGKVALVMVASDAAHAGRINAVRQAEALTWGDKQSLGELFGRSELGVIAICDHALAEGVALAVRRSALAQDAREKCDG